MPETRQHLTIISEAPTPHNNYFFAALARDKSLSVEAHYLYRPNEVPGRPWKTLEAELPGLRDTRVGINRWFDLRLLSKAIFNSRETLFVIGWNVPLFYLILCIRGFRRGSLLMWFDTPQPSNLTRPRGLRRALKRFVVRMINRTPGTIFVTGGLAANGMCELGIRRDKTAKLPFFVPVDRSLLTDQGRMASKAACGIASESLVVLAAGRLIHSKGFDVFLDALIRLRKHVSDGWVAILVGSGPESDSLLQRAQSGGLGEKFHCIPWMEPDEFNKVMAVTDVFVAPARFDPFPTTVLSAMALGKVVIATDGVGSAVEFIEPNRSGMLCPKGRADVMAEALEQVLNSRALRERLGRQAAVDAQAWPVERGVSELKAALERLGQS